MSSPMSFSTLAQRVREFTKPGRKHSLRTKVRRPGQGDWVGSEWLWKISFLHEAELHHVMLKEDADTTN